MTLTRREALLCGFASTLIDDSTARLLERDFPRPDLSYLLLDFGTRRIVASRWTSPEQPVPLGSLIKPFAAFAHGSPFPEVVCRGEPDRCWKPGGHGKLSLPNAIAYSCNAYFLAIAPRCDATTLARLSLSGPRYETPETWIGLGGGWPIAPVTLARAYCELVASNSREILRGMRLSAKLGTAHLIACDAYAKTGTAPCHHRKKSAGDGYAMALFPAETPRVALLAGLDGSPGSIAARTCGEMLSKVAASLR